MSDREPQISSRTRSPGLLVQTVRMSNWKTDAFADADTLVFKPPAGVAKVDLASSVIMEFDELPPGTSAGVKKGGFHRDA